MVVASIDWSTVIVAGMTMIPATIAALASLGNRRSLRTSNGATIGETVSRGVDIGTSSQGMLTDQEQRYSDTLDEA